jgi:streptogramin lyase
MLVQPAAGDTTATWHFEPYNSTDPSAHFTSAPTTPVPGLANDVVFDGSGNAWIASELSNGLTEVTAAGVRHVLSVPSVPTEPRPFYWDPSGTPGQSSASTYAEQVVDGPNQTVWFTEGGAEGADPAAGYSNQSRIIGYDPTAAQFCIYDTPTASGATPTDVVLGTAWDSINHRIWFTDLTNSTVNWFTAPTSSCGAQSGPSGSTNGTLTRLVACPTSNPPAGCVHSIPLVFQGTHVDTMAFDPATSAAYPNGSVWYVDLYGAAVERVNIATSAVTLYALPATRGVTPVPTYLATDSGNSMYVAEYGDGDLVRINKTTGAVDEVEAPSFAPGASSCVSGVSPGGNSALPAIHTVALSASGRLYFSTTYCDASGAAQDAVGYLNVNTWDTGLTGYLLTGLPATACTAAPCSLGFGLGGIAVSPVNGNVMTTDMGDGQVIDLLAGS